MREIRFRVRERVSKSFVGYECLMPDISNDGFQWAKSFGGSDWEGGTYNKDYYLREQFTGLRDKNGVEIYEGDLLRYCAHYPRDYQERQPLKKYGRIAGPVVWEKGWLWVDYRVEDDDGTLLYEKEAKDWEVIGNIYENPELLK